MNQCSNWFVTKVDPKLLSEFGKPLVDIGCSSELLISGDQEIFDWIITGQGFFQ